MRALVRGAFSACLILLFSTGGGTLPVLDGLLFHSRDRGAESLRPHLEATSACHADGCSIRSTAQQGRFTPALEPVASVLAVPDGGAPQALVGGPLRLLLTGQPLSRAPPLFS